MVEWLLGVDESGTTKTPVSGFGALLMRWERRGDFARDFQAVLDNHPRHAGEVKWNKMGTRGSYDLGLELIDYFFQRRWLCFHCMVVRKALVGKQYHKDYDEAWRKNLCMFLVDKAKLFARTKQDEHLFRVWADDIPSRYQKAAEALDIIANNKLRKGSGSIQVAVTEHNSKEKPIIQLADLLLGAIVTSNARTYSSGLKLKLQEHIAARLGWDHLQHGTYAAAPLYPTMKFNVWHLHDEHGVRQVPARKLNLHWPWPGK